MRDKAVSEGHRKAGKMVQGTAKNLCPVDTGQLKNSITEHLETPTREAVGTNVEHGIFAEFGTGQKGDTSVPHTSKEFWRYQGANGNWHTTHGQPPRPFLAPALHQNEKAIPQILKEELQTAIKKVGGIR